MISYTSSVGLLWWSKVRRAPTGGFHVHDHRHQRAHESRDQTAYPIAKAVAKSSVRHRHQEVICRERDGEAEYRTDDDAFEQAFLVYCLGIT
jgi:hypothetical protein